MKRTGAQIIWECLLREGVEVVFGYPGGANLPLFDAMLDYPIRHVLPRHEQGGAHMADGYARASGKVGVAIATSGPGATNLVTGIATAMLDSIPVVFITAQVGSKLIGYDAFQEIDMTGITLPITKHNYLVTDAHDLTHVIREAFYIARTGRPGPVLIDITKDAQQATINWTYDDSPVQLPGYRPEPRPARRDFGRALELIQAAQRPVILAGHGVLQAGAMNELVQFAEMTHTPVALTLLGIGALPASHPLNLGMMGMHGESWVNMAIQEADLILAMGMRFDDRVTGNLNTYAGNAVKIHFEVDPAEVNKNVRVDVPLVGDLRFSLQQMLPNLKRCDHSVWLEHIAEMRSESAQRDIQNQPDNGKLYAAHVINDLRQTIGSKGIIVTDVGQHQMWAAQYCKIERPDTWISSGGLGTMGFGLPAAIGAKLAHPEAEVWLIVGDGGFQMTMSELATAAQENVKVNVALINNSYLGMVRQWQELFYERRYAATPLKNPDFAKIAEAMGLTGMRVTQRSEVVDAVRRAQQAEGTAVIEFRVENEDLVYPMVPAGADLHDMIRRPHPQPVPSSFAFLGVKE